MGVQDWKDDSVIKNAFAKDLGLVLTNDMASNNHLYFQFQRIQHPFLASVGTVCMWYIDIYASKTLLWDNALVYCEDVSLLLI